MKIKSVQTIIKIGSSAGVTIPAKDLKQAGLKVGDNLLMTVEPVQSVDQHKIEIVALTQKLIARHQKALKNLSQR